MTFKFFLATDILKVAERPLDPSSVVSLNPTRDDSYCKVCHKVMDPVAGAFQKWDRDGRYMPEANWPASLPQPGLGREVVEDVRDYPKALSWLGERMAADPRFVVATVATVLQALVGRPPLAYPPADAPDFPDRLTAWREQEAMLRRVGEELKANHFNLKVVFKALVKSEAFRAVDGKGPPGRLAGLGAGRLLTPELLSRRITALTGVSWLRYDRKEWLRNDYNLLYGGIDSNVVTERLTEPNGIMSNLGLRMADEVSCLVTAWEFTRPAASRSLLPLVEIADRPEDDKGVAQVMAGQRIRANVRHLHARLLGEELADGDPEIERTTQLFLDTYRELAATKKGDLPYDCQGRWDRTTGAALPKEKIIDQDKSYTIRSWMAVVSYLLADWKFLHE